MLTGLNELDEYVRDNKLVKIYMMLLRKFPISLQNYDIYCIITCFDEAYDLIYHRFFMWQNRVREVLIQKRVEEIENIECYYIDRV